MKPILRNILKKFRRLNVALTDEYDRHIAPQEMLDVLATVAGMKPTYLGGRGFSSQQWLHGIARISEERGLRLIWGRKWNTIEGDEELPNWFSNLQPARVSEELALYVFRSKAIAQEVEQILITGDISISDEARLLGYPHCCVEDHHRRLRAHCRLLMLLLKRYSAGDESEMKRLVREDVEMIPKTDEEVYLSNVFARIRPAPFTSILMCDSCEQSPKSPARRLSKQYADLARDIDVNFFHEVEASSAIHLKH